MSVRLRYALSWCPGLLLVFACGSHQPVAHAVAIRGFNFVPAIITVQAGDTLVWTNEDIVPHTATAESRRLDSGLIDSRGTARFVVSDTGRVDIRCTYHPAMRGTIVVQ